MSEPINANSSYEIKGGVRYNINQATYSYDEKVKRHILTFTDGAILRFKTQSTENESSVDNYFDDNYTLTNICGAEFIGTKDKIDFVNLEGCNNCYVKTNNDIFRDFITACSSEKYMSKNNVFKAGENDIVEICTTTNKDEDKNCAEIKLEKDETIYESKIRDKLLNSSVIQKILHKLFGTWNK